MRWSLCLLVAACYRPTLEKPCEVTCASGACPDHLVCTNGMCTLPGGACSTGPDADVDGASNDAPDAAVPICPPGMTLAFQEDFSNTNLPPPEWSVVKLGTGDGVFANAAFGSSTPPALRMTRTATEGFLISRLNPPLTSNLMRLYVRLDTNLANTAAHEIVFAQVETDSGLVRLKAASTKVTLQGKASGGNIGDLGQGYGKPSTWAPVYIDITMAGPLDLTVGVGSDTPQSFDAHPVGPTGTLRLLFGAHDESSGMAGTPSVDLDNIIVCTVYQ